MDTEIKIPLDFTNEHLKQIFETYESVGLPIKQNLNLDITTEMVRERLNNLVRHEFEVTPQPFGPANNKLIFRKWHDRESGQSYIHVFVVPNSEPAEKILKICKSFHENIKRIFS